MHRLVTALALSACVGASGCATKIGARSLPDVRRSYNEALSESADQQMLLNVVRLRHLHTTSFLQLSSVVTQYSIGSSASVNGTANFGESSFAPPGSLGGSVGVSANERPTVTYVPLQGEEFVRRMATPLNAEGIALLVHAGWGWDLIFGCCVNQVNDLYSPEASSLTGDHPFTRLGALMAQLQWRHELEVVVGNADDGHRAHLFFRRLPDGTFSAEAQEARRLLGLGSDVNHIVITDEMIGRPGGAVALRGRSLLGALFYLSQGVRVPDDARGARALGPRYTPEDPWLHVSHANAEPKSAYVAVPYEGTWYYLDDTDETSKRMFSLLSFLFLFMSSPKATGPVLTVPAGG